MSALFITLVGLTITLFSDKMLISHRCISGLMPNLIKKSRIDSNWQPHKQQRETAAATTTNKRTVYIVGKYSIYCKQKKMTKFIDIIEKGFISFSNVLSEGPTLYLVFAVFSIFFLSAQNNYIYTT